jgi:hypothetical protein
MTVSSPNVIEIKLDRLIDDMRLLRSQMIAFDKHLKGIEACLKTSEASELQPESKSRPWFAAAAIATARTVSILSVVGLATSAVLLYLGTWPDNGITNRGGLFFLAQIRGALLLIGQPVPFLSYLKKRGAVLPEREAPGHETAITGKMPIFFRFARHDRRPSNRR